MDLTGVPRAARGHWDREATHPHRNRIASTYLQQQLVAARNAEARELGPGTYSLRPSFDTQPGRVYVSLSQRGSRMSPDNRYRSTLPGPGHYGDAHPKYERLNSALGATGFGVLHSRSQRPSLVVHGDGPPPNIYNALPSRTHDAADVPIGGSTVDRFPDESKVCGGSARVRASYVCMLARLAAYCIMLCCIPPCTCSCVGWLRRACTWIVRACNMDDAVQLVLSASLVLAGCTTCSG